MNNEKLASLRRQVIRKIERAKAWARANPKDPFAAVILAEGREAKLHAAKQALRAKHGILFDRS
jgi:hypothetical protein